ncbi:MAG: thiolase family protein [Planctomycetota bacterium]
MSVDEGVRPGSTADGLGKLRPAFAKDGTVTAGNASQISDGAAATIVCSAEKAEHLGLSPIARVVAYHTSGVAPKDIFAAPIDGIAGVLDKAGLKATDIDLFEINEAFAAQVLCNLKGLKDRGVAIPEEKLNICGGGIALGHPIGASGARVLTTLLHQLVRTGGKRGLAALCLGGGQQRRDDRRAGLNDSRTAVHLNARAVLGTPSAKNCASCVPPLRWFNGCDAVSCRGGP